MEPYFTAKYRSDTWLMEQSQLDWTVLRPSTLIDGPGTGKIQLAPGLHITGSITRADVGAVALALLEEPKVIGLLADVHGPEEGKQSFDVAEAVQKAVARV